MTEDEYIILTNRVSVSHANKILNDVLPGKKYGVSEQKLKSIMADIAMIELNLFENQLQKET